MKTMFRHPESGGKDRALPRQPGLCRRQRRFHRLLDRRQPARRRPAGRKTFDEPPFFWLQGFIALNAFIISTTVLIRQNRMSRLADHHAHLDLQVNLLTEEKSSKIIALLEELRRDMPNVRNKTDHEAEALAKPADAKAVLSAIEREQDDCA
jgi:uncharacterized membrane protein